MSNFTYQSQPCDRCGSKRIISKSWTETVESFSGTFSKVEVSQIVCSNVECQQLFEKKQAETQIKNNEAKLIREKQEEQRRKERQAQVKKLKEKTNVKAKTKLKKRK